MMDWQRREAPGSDTGGKPVPRFGDMMPEYPRSGARGVKPLRNRDAAAPKSGELLTGDGTLFMETLAVVLVSGGGLLMSTTQDGGALSVTLYLGDERFRSYATDREELDALLEAVRDHAEAFMLERRASTHQTRTKRPSGQ